MYTCFFTYNKGAETVPWYGVTGLYCTVKRNPKILLQVSKGSDLEVTAEKNLLCSHVSRIKGQNPNRQFANKAFVSLASANDSSRHSGASYL
jgi:hypothetical protein